MRRWTALFGLLIASPAFGSITLTQSNSSSTAAVNTVNLAFTGNVANGDLIIACTNFGNNAAGSVYTVTDNKSGGSNTYTSFTNVVLNTGTFGDLTCAWAIHSGSAANLTETVACTLAATCGSHTLRFAVFDYASTTGWLASPVDTGNTNNSSSGVTTGNPGAITPAASGELLFAAIEFGSAITTNLTTTNCTRQSAPDGTNTSSGWASSARAGSCDVQNTSNSSTTATFNWSTAVAYSALVTAFKPAAAGAAAPARHKIIQN